MLRFLVVTLMAACLLLAGWFPSGPAASQAQALNPNPPPATVRLVFIHHSVGENLLNAGLFAQLNANNYYVTDTYYGWGPDSIGDYTDIGQWYNWFLGPASAACLTALYDNTFIREPIENPMPQPAGPNTVVLFKSCFPNSRSITGNPDDPPRLSSPTDPNPIQGVAADQPEDTVANIKGLYRDLLAYFATRPDKLFILLTSPPVTTDDEAAYGVAGSAARARAINTWLVNHWLDGYPFNNVAVFDFFNVQTSNGGDIDTNDLGATTGNHHRLLAGQVQHLTRTANHYAAYAAGGDNHPSEAGSLKGAGEFVPLLNVAYHAWQGTGGRPLFMGRSPKPLAAVNLLLLSDLTLTSAAFAHGGLIPDKYTMRDGVGQNISIPLAWSQVPPGTRSFALSMVDRHPDANNYVHWLAVNIPPTASSLPEGATLNMPDGTRQLNNSWGDPHYWGPYPSIGSGLHPYEITVYALNTATLDLPVASDLEAFQTALAGKVLESANITGYYRID